MIGRIAIPEIRECPLSVPGGRFFLPTSSEALGCCTVELVASELGHEHLSSNPHHTLPTFPLEGELSLLSPLNLQHQSAASLGTKHTAAGWKQAWWTLGPGVCPRSSALWAEGLTLATGRRGISEESWGVLALRKGRKGLREIIRALGWPEGPGSLDSESN